MTKPTRVKTLRQAVQQLRGDLKDGRGLSSALESCATGLSLLDQEFLDGMVKRDSNTHWLIKSLTAYLEETTDWIVVVLSDSGEEIRHHYPTDLDAAAKRLQEYVMRGKTAKLIAA
ncbi:hypothetical protein [Kosakonia phage Kc237]|nr:hypothetical protein [Kosakonia phage Kc237]